MAGVKTREIRQFEEPWQLSQCGSTSSSLITLTYASHVLRRPAATAHDGSLKRVMPGDRTRFSSRSCNGAASIGVQRARRL